MATKHSSENGKNRLEEAMAMLIQNQASFLGRMAESDRRLSEIEQATSERIGRIEKDVLMLDMRCIENESVLVEQLEQLSQPV